MIILIFGVSNVGKSSVGQQLAALLGYRFIDLDDELRSKFATTLEDFKRENPLAYERSKIKGEILKDLVNQNIKNNVVIAVSPIFYARHINRLLDMEHVLGIELQDTEQHIFDRLVFSDKNDDYKTEYQDYYFKDIHQDIMYMRKVFKKITNKVFIDNRPIDLVAADLAKLVSQTRME